MISLDKRNITVSEPQLTSTFLFRQSQISFAFHEKVDAKEVELRNKCLDPDPRVRTEAVQALEELCQNGKIISIDSYPIISNLCTNSAMKVRLAALKIVQKFAERYPEHIVKTEHDFQLRLHDDAFALVCHAMNDIETEVRTEAAKLLGLFECVSDKFLDQTLDKKVMSTMQFADKSGKVRTGGWNAGKTMGEDVQDDADEDEGHSMIPIGACGAFVSGLEDEFMSVRQAAVYSLGRLAANRPDFARSSIDHLADMFNDEMQQVRLDSIQALTPLIVHGTLAKDQLHTILSVLSDAIPDNRLALHELLGKSNLADHTCIKQVLKALMDSMKRYSRDRDSIYRCLSKIGRRHSVFIQPLVPDLLNIHPLFIPHEQDVNDEFYLCNLILVLNAAYAQEPICSLIPEYILRHYRYLRQSSPDLIPAIETFEQRRTSSNLKFTESDAQTGVNKHLQLIYQRIYEAYCNPVHEDKVSLLKLILKDLKVTENAEEQFSCPLLFLKSFCEVLLLYDTCIRRQYDEENVVHVVEECLIAITQLQNLFGGMSKSILTFLKEIELQLNVLYVLRKMGMEPSTDWTGINLMLQTEIVRVQQYVLAQNMSQTDNFQRFQNFMIQFLATHKESPRQNISAKLNKKAALMPLISTEVSNVVFEMERNRIPFKDNKFDLRLLRRKSAKSLEFWHGGNWYHSDMGGIRFVAGIPVGIEVYSTLYNLTKEDKERFRIEIVYPNNRRHYHKPSDRHLIEISDSTYRLQTTVLLVADEPWAIASDVRLSCGLLLDEDTSSTALLDYQNRSTFVPLLNFKRPSRKTYSEIKIHPMSKC